MELRVTAGAKDEGRLLRDLLRNTLRLSSACIRQLKAADAFVVNGERVFVNLRLHEGDEISLTLTEPEPDFPAEDGELCILYEDEALLALNKPRGMIVHPTHSRLTGTLAGRAWKHIRDGGGDGCHVINRLDRDTGGIVLFAKNSHVCARMSGQITEKTYLAVVCGVPEAESGSITFPIRRLNETDMKRICAPDGSDARTDYRVLASADGLSLLQLRLHTGRTHQIRVHCAEMGWPLLGDRLYASPESQCVNAALGESVQNLWCVRMRFVHPLSGAEITLEAQPETLPRLFEGKSELKPL